MKLLHFVKYSHHNKFFLGKIEGFVDQLFCFLDNVDNRVIARTSVEFLEQVIIALGLVLISIEDRKGLKNSILKGNKQSIDSLLLILQRGSSNSKIVFTRVLQFC